MTLVFYVNMIPASLTVPDEAVRGLFYKNRWIICVSDPMTMAVSRFRIPRALEKKAAEDMDMKRITHRDGKKFLAWLLAQEYVEVEYIDEHGRPSQRPAQRVVGPRPAMDRPGPTTSVPTVPKPPAPQVDLNPADKPHKLNHPLDRPSDLSF